MNRIARILPLLALLVVACQKEGGSGEEDGKGKKVSFSLKAPSVTVNGTPETRTWAAGDKLSMFAYKAPTTAGLLSSGNVVNFSSNRFSAESAGATATFTGYIPKLDGKIPDGNHPLYIICPPCNLTVSAQSYRQEPDGAYYQITGPSIAQRQDGSGWRYCWFISNDGTISTAKREITAAPTFSLVNALIRFHYVSGKDIKKIVVEQEEHSLPGLAGAFTLHTNQKIIAEGCETYSINIENGGNPLPGEILFACCHIPKGRTLSFTFTSMDGTQASRSIIVPANCGSGKVSELNTIDLNEWTNEEFASQTVKNMGMGINVGGLDSVSPTTEAIADRADANGMHILDRNDPVTYETNGAKDRITQKMMNALYEAGFHSVRIPVTWFNHIGPPVSGEGIIDEVWLNHIRSVVDLARNAGMYVVINIHHDAGTYDYCWLSADWSKYNSVSLQLKNIWTQIANHFKDYDYHLLFEGYNEICDEYKSWWAPRGPDGFKAANALNQDFVNAVRATGGNNSIRNLVVSTYTASEHSEALDGFVLPLDIVEGHLIVQIHSYRPNEFITAREVGDRSRMEFYESDKPEIDEMFDRVQAKILDKGWPCIMGEYGAFHKKDANGKRNEEGRGAHGYYYTINALRKGIAPMYWYNPMEYRDRDDGRWTYPILADSLKKAWRDYQAEQQ